MATTPSDAELRVSDADRERAMDALRAHAGDGRIDLEELDQRLDAVLAARTREDLKEVFADLPDRSSTRDRDPDFAPHLRVYIAVNALLVAIWALTGMGYFWPVWPLLGWGVGVLAHGTGGRSCVGRRFPLAP
jgi:hypothetical protein